MKSKIIFLVATLIFVGIAGTTQAQTTATDVLSAYRSYKDVQTPILQTIPTVLEIPFANEYIERYDFAVLNVTTNKFEPHYYRQETLTNETRFVASSLPYVSGISYLLDKNSNTYASFPLRESSQGTVQIRLKSGTPVTSSMLTILLDKNVTLPSRVEIWATIGGQKEIVVAERIMTSQTIQFPKTTTDEWTINFTYNQPLRISELRLAQEGAIKANSHAVRFLAQPTNSYRIYFNPDRYARPTVPEAGNLASAQDIFFVEEPVTQPNPTYAVADTDEDGVPDVIDNCKNHSNSDQIDVNSNGIGDVCDDFDKDYIINSEDNCPDNPNRNQRDVDADGIGDVCDDQESRLTEQYPWIPWLGIGFAALVLVVLLAVTARSTIQMRREEESEKVTEHEGGENDPVA